MSYDDEKYFEKLNDPLASNISLDHEIAATVIPVGVIQPVRPHLSDDQFHQTEKAHPKADYAVLNNFLLHIELGHILHVEKMIHQPGIHLDYQNSFGHTPLMVAILHSHSSSSHTVKLVRILLDNDADPDILDNDGLSVFTHACQSSNESVVRTLIRYGADTHHRLLPTLSHLQEHGHMNVLYALITHFAVEQEFPPRCGACNYASLLTCGPLKRTQKSVKCCIGNKHIRNNEIYYKCEICRTYIVCKGCQYYGVLKCMLQATKQSKYQSLSRCRMAKYEIAKRIRQHKQLRNPQRKHMKCKQRTETNLCIQNINLEQMLVLNAADLSDSDSSNGIDADDAVPNFFHGKGLQAMKHVFKHEEYWKGDKVLLEKEWREICWMDTSLQLQWLLMLRRNILYPIKDALLSQSLFDLDVVNILMQMICGGICTINPCFFNQTNAMSLV